MDVAFWIGVLACTAVAANLLSLIIATVRIRGRRTPIPVPAHAPAVSIVRPVCGIEQFSEETLRAAYRIDYPAYEIVYCVARAGDPIIPLVERAIAENPHVPSRIVIGDEPISDNPKLNNCVRGWDAAVHDWIILADSNVLMPVDYVQRLLASFRPDTGLVCSTPVGSRPENVWAELECAFLNTLQARWQYAGEALGFGFAQGKSMLWRRDVLDSRGGIRALAAEIAEDAASTKLVRRAGLHVHLVDSPFEQPLGTRTAAEVWSRQLRWARLRRVTFPLFFAPEIFTGATLPMAGAAYAASSYGLSAALAVAAVAILWYGPEVVLARSKGWRLSPRLVAGFVVRDVMLVPMWLYAWVAEDIVWRGNAMSVRTKGSAQVSADGAAV